MKFREIEDYGLKILTERKDGTMDIYAKFAEVEKPTSNGRIYPHRIMKREIDRVQAKISSGQFLGQADHGDSVATSLKSVSHLVKKLELVGSEGFATIRILNTEAGKNAQQILKGGGRIGLSTKSAGTVSKTGRVNDDLKLLSLDLVVDPAVKDATFSKENILENILEGVEFEEIKRISTAPIQRKVTPASVYLEAKIAGIDPKIYAERLNANLERQEKSDPDLSPAEVVFVLNEARQSGIDMSDEKERKRILDIHKRQKTHKIVLTEDERAEIVAKRTGSTVALVKEIWGIEKKKRKKAGHYSLLASERMASGFGSEIRPESRKISQKILDKE